MTAGCSFELSGHEVHIWALRTSVAGTLAARFEGVLAPEEKDRAVRFRFDSHRHSFIVRRGTLRCLLGSYLNLHPASIRFHYGSKGKPALALPAGIEFNVTHSSGLAVFAFTAGCQLGVDLEQICLMPDVRNIADRFFCAEEAAEIMSLPPGERECAFFSCWTRKESYIKATGDGLSAPLDGFRVTLRPNEPARLIHIAQDKNAARLWTLHDLPLSPDYAAALAYRDRQRALSVFAIADPAEFLTVL